MDPLPLAVCLLWSYRTRDFHPLDYTHAGRTPYSRFAGLPPEGGSLLSSVFSANLSCSFYSIARTSPSGGGAVGRRGAFPTGASPVCLFFQRPPGRLSGFIIRGALHKLNGAHHLPPQAAYILIAAKGGDTTILGAKGAVKPKNLRAEGPSTLTPSACQKI